MEKKSWKNSFTPKQGFAAVGISFALAQALVFVLLMASIFVSLIFQFNENVILENNLFNMILSLATQAAFFVGVVLVCRREKIDFKKAIGFKKIATRNVFIILLISIVAIFGFYGLIEIFSAALVALGYQTPQGLPLPTDGFGWFVICGLLFAFLPAVCEEVVFRGAVLNGLKDFGKKKAVLISALFFMLIHGALSQSLFQFVLGIILALVAIECGSIMGSMLLHFFNNIIVLILGFAFPSFKYPIFGKTVFSFANVATYAIMATVSFVAILVFVKSLKKSKEDCFEDLQEDADAKGVLVEKFEPSKNAIRKPTTSEKFFFWLVTICGILIVAIEFFGNILGG